MSFVLLKVKKLFRPAKLLRN